MRARSLLCLVCFAAAACAPHPVTAIVRGEGEGEGSIGEGEGSLGEGEGEGEGAVDRGTYANPVFSADFPDPFVVVDGARYVAFATNGDGGFGLVNVPTATSTDLSHWSAGADALPALPSWAQGNSFLTWAPSVLAPRRAGDAWVLYFTARDIASGFQCVGRATSASASGPYVDDSGAPLVCQADLCGSIDASPFVDDSAPYLLWKSDENACGNDARLWSAQLSDDGLAIASSPVELLRRDQAWEEPLIEGPSMTKIPGGGYALFYSANNWESDAYAVGYAVCDAPSGPCSKRTVDGPLLSSSGDVSGPGGQEVLIDAFGAVWLTYHAWTAGAVGYGAGGSRSLRMEPLSFDGDVPVVNGPTTSPQPL